MFQDKQCMTGLGTLLTGIGTLALAGGAIFAAINADTVLDKIVGVQTTVYEIKNTNNELKNTLDEIKKANKIILDNTNNLVQLARMNVSKKDFFKPSEQSSTVLFMNKGVPLTAKQATSDQMQHKDVEKEAEILNQNLKADFSKETSDKRPWGLYLKDEKREEIVNEYKNKRLNLEQIQTKVSEALDSTVLEELKQNKPPKEGKGVPNPQNKMGDVE